MGFLSLFSLLILLYFLYLGRDTFIVRGFIFSVLFFGCFFALYFLFTTI